MKKENLWKKTLSFALAFSFVAQSAVTGTQFTKISAEPDESNGSAQNNTNDSLAVAKETLKAQIEANSAVLISYCKTQTGNDDDETAKAVISELKNGIDDLNAEELAALQSELASASTDPAALATAINLKALLNDAVSKVVQSAAAPVAAKEYFDRYVKITDLQVGDIISELVYALQSSDNEYTMTLKAGGYTNYSGEVAAIDKILNKSSMYFMESGYGLDGQYFPCYNGKKADEWQVAAIDHEAKTITLTGYSAPESAPNPLSGDNIKFYEYDDDSNSLVSSETEASSCYQVVTTDRVWENGSIYVVTEDTTFEKRIVVEGFVKLILLDGVTLTAKQGIQVNEGSQFAVYAQSTGKEAGKLFAGTTNGTDTTIASSPENAAIGGNSRYVNGTISIYGGIINARSNCGAAAIGGGQDSECGTVNIYGGDITASVDNANYSASIGGGYYKKGGTVNVFGGKVTACNQNQESVPSWNVSEDAVIIAGNDAVSAEEVSKVGTQYYLSIDAGAAVPTEAAPESSDTLAWLESTAAIEKYEQMGFKTSEGAKNIIDSGSLSASLRGFKTDGTTSDAMVIPAGSGMMDTTVMAAVQQGVRYIVTESEYQEYLSASEVAAAKKAEEEAAAAKLAAAKTAAKAAEEAAAAEAAKKAEEEAAAKLAAAKTAAKAEVTKAIGDEASATIKALAAKLNEKIDEAQSVEELAALKEQVLAQLNAQAKAEAEAAAKAAEEKAKAEAEAAKKAEEEAAAQKAAEEAKKAEEEATAKLAAAKTAAKAEVANAIGDEASETVKALAAKLNEKIDEVQSVEELAALKEQVLAQLNAQAQAEAEAAAKAAEEKAKAEAEAAKKAEEEAAAQKAAEEAKKAEEEVAAAKLAAAKTVAKAEVANAIGDEASETIKALAAQLNAKIDEAQSIEELAALKEQVLAQLNAQAQLEAEAAAKAAEEAAAAEAAKKAEEEAEAAKKAEEEAAAKLAAAKIAAKAEVAKAIGDEASATIKALAAKLNEKIDEAQSIEELAVLKDQVLEQLTAQAKAEAEAAVKAAEEKAKAEAEAAKKAEEEAAAKAAEEAAAKAAAEKAANELMVAKSVAVAEVEEVIGKNPSDTVRELSDQLIALIGEVSSTEELEVLRAEVLKTISVQIKAEEETAAMKAAEEARKAEEEAAAAKLAAAKTAAKAEVANAIGDEASATIKVLAAQLNAKIDEAQSVEALAALKDQVIAKLTAQMQAEAEAKAARAFAELKENAKAEVVKAAGTDPSDAVKAIIADAEKMIDTAKSDVSVFAARNEAVSKITAQIRTESIKKIDGVAATHTTIGQKTYWTVDGKNYEDAECTKEIANLAEWIVIPKDNTHIFGEWETKVAATCTEDGEEIHTCECGETETKVVKAHGHEFGEWKVSVGVRVRSCEFCDETESETLPSDPAAVVEMEKNEANSIEGLEDNNYTREMEMPAEEAENVVDLSEEEKALIAEGKTFKMTTSVQNIFDSIPQEQKEKAEKVLAANEKILGALDIVLTKQIGDIVTGRATELKQELPVYISIPKEVYNESKIYSLIREHEGKLTKIKLSSLGGCNFSFRSSEFSTYYIVEEDPEIHVHEYGEWKTTQTASWTRDGIETRICECGETETRVFEENWTEQAISAICRKLRKLLG